MICFFTSFFQSWPFDNPNGAHLTLKRSLTISKRVTGKSLSNICLKEINDLNSLLGIGAKILRIFPNEFGWLFHGLNSVFLRKKKVGNPRLWAKKKGHGWVRGPHNPILRGQQRSPWLLTTYPSPGISSFKWSNLLWHRNINQHLPFGVPMKPWRDGK